jgi:sugar-specific transcriptional regulator TrmB
MNITNAQLQEIRESLTIFGLSHAEQDAYFALLEGGLTPASPIAKTLSIPLTTAQSLLQRLATRGLVHVTKRKSRAVYEAKDPVVFKSLLEQHLQEMTSTIPLLRLLRTEEVTSARIRIYSRERMTDIFRHALTTKEKRIYEIVSAHELQELLGERFHFTKRRMAEGIQLKSLRVESQEIKAYSARTHERELREAKFLPKELTFKCSIMFWDDTVAFFTPPSEGLAWVVRSKETCVMLKQIFDLLWSVSRRMETLKES